MKKVPVFFMTMMLLIPSLVYAVTWQADSAPFTFPDVSVSNSQHRDLVQPVFRCLPAVTEGILTFEYQLPATVKNAALNIYSLDGALVKNWKLPAGQTAIQWNVTGSMVAAGVYVASLQYGTVERHIRIYIIK